MNPLHLIDTIQLDRRSKIPHHQQLFKHLYQWIIEAKISNDTCLPGVHELANGLQLPVKDIETAIRALNQHGLLKKVDNVWHVTYKSFDYDLDAEYSGIDNAIKYNGFASTMVKYDSRLIKADKVKAVQPEFVSLGDLYELRVDYYADDMIFGVTMNYIPSFLTKDLNEFIAKKDRINELYQPHVKTLSKTYSHKAVLFPDYVSESFGLTPGHAGTLIEMEYHDERGRLMHLYKGYITNRYVLTLDHFAKKALSAT